MAMMSALFHEGQAKERYSESRRNEKYGGKQKADTMVDLSEPSIPGVLMKKIVRPGNGELPPVGSMVREQENHQTYADVSLEAIVQQRCTLAIERVRFFVY